jgi:DNA-binding MarR family transcriptional regulator/GNAT superfamily N-acetyltransferase
MGLDTSASRAAAVRRFNRFYTRQIGVLGDGWLESPFSLAEARVLYELAHRETPAAKELAADLGLDPGYVSRILQRLRGRRLVAQETAAADGRRRLLSLTAAGRRAFGDLDSRANEEARRLLARVPDGPQRRIVDAMAAIEGALGASQELKVPYILRPHQPGDIGWVIERHGALYAREYGWDAQFEALVARIAARFLEKFDPRYECCWIAEREGERVGSVFLVKRTPTVAQLRMLLVEPAARGLGIGKRLVDECERFARQTGYRKIMLWTNSVLDAARHIYERAGYTLVKQERHESFGKKLVSQFWELKL